MLWVLIRSTSAVFLWRNGENYPRIITEYSSLTSPLPDPFMIVLEYDINNVERDIKHQSIIVKKFCIVLDGGIDLGHM